MEQRSYSKKELAQLYFPNASSAEIARNQFVVWINRCPELVEKLKETGYKRRGKILTPKQVEIIRFYLGDP